MAFDDEYLRDLVAEVRRGLRDERGTATAELSTADEDPAVVMTADGRSLSCGVTE